MKIKVETPAKINLSLKVGAKREDGFHPIDSIMQTISLFDYLTIELLDKGIELSGNSNEIPYDGKNIVYRAAELFFKEYGACGTKIYIEKNIPISAGLAGGSTNAAGTIFGLNKLLDEPFSRKKLHEMCAQLGSDLNFCLEGGKCRCLGRGEILEQLPFEEFNVTLVKPKNLGISAREAYQRFDELKEISNLPNDLEFALLPHYKELQTLHSLDFQMSGSGPTFFIIGDNIPSMPSDCEVFKELKAIPYGVIEKH